MTVKNPKCLVIDASILRGAGGENATHPKPIRCRDFLAEVQALGHKVIVTREIKQEWDKHIEVADNPLTTRWYTNMRRRNQIQFVMDDIIDQDLRDMILSVLPKDVHKAVTKDFRLIEGALQADEIVSSLDEKMREHFKRASIKVDEIASIVWVNPANQDEECIIWLRQSAPADDFRKLGK